MSRLFTQTLRQPPADSDITSHRLLTRAGFILPLAAGIFSYLPLAKRTLKKIENIIREEINAIGGQEVSLPVVNPADLWKESRRWYQIGSELGRFKDKNDREMVLAMTHEEVVADLVRKVIKSYRQLPSLIYHIQTKWRDDPRPRGGLIRARELTMKDSFSLDADWEGLHQQYLAHYQAYFNIFHRCDLDVKAFRSDVGIMGGSLAHEFMYLTPMGEDTLFMCEHCGYAANRQVAYFKKHTPEPETPAPLTKVYTPGAQTIQALADFLGIPASKTAKAVFLIATIVREDQTYERLVFAIVRGDMELNETKLANAIGARDLRPAQEDDIRAAGAVPGYASPIGLKNVLVVMDDLIEVSPNLVAGANEEGYHFLNVNYGRDYQADIIADIASAEAGRPCPRCEEPLAAVRGIEVGNIFKLGTRFSEALGCYYQDDKGSLQPVIMGSYGIGTGRLMASIAEAHHDELGLIWPITVAPFSVHLVALGVIKSGTREDPTDLAERVYRNLQENGIEVLYDDRDESSGVKFNDADLIGCPIRLTVSKRAIQSGGVEVKRRDSPDRVIVSEGDLMNHVNGLIDLMKDEIERKVVKVPFIE